MIISKYLELCPLFGISFQDPKKAMKSNGISNVIAQKNTTFFKMEIRPSYLEIKMVDVSLLPCRSLRLQIKLGTKMRNIN